MAVFWKCDTICTSDLVQTLVLVGGKEQIALVKCKLHEEIKMKHNYPYDIQKNETINKQIAELTSRLSYKTIGLSRLSLVLEPKNNWSTRHWQRM